VGHGIFGIGLGYSLKTTDNLVQAETKITAKADSVGLYVKQIGHKLLPFLLGPTSRYAGSSPQGRPKTSITVAQPQAQQRVLSSMPPSQSLIAHSQSSKDKSPPMTIPSAKIKSQATNQRMSQGPYLIGGSSHLVNGYSP
jgi:hypothetical protein